METSKYLTVKAFIESARAMGDCIKIYDDGYGLSVSSSTITGIRPQ